MRHEFHAIGKGTPGDIRTGNSEAEAAWRFFANNPGRRVCNVQTWCNDGETSQLVNIERWTPAMVRSVIPGSLQAC